MLVCGGPWMKGQNHCKMQRPKRSHWLCGVVRVPVAEPGCSWELTWSWQPRTVPFTEGSRSWWWYAESRDVAESWVVFEGPVDLLAGGALWFQLWCCNPLGRGRESSKVGCGALFLSFLNSCLPTVCGYGNEAGKQVMQQQMSPLEEFFRL